MNTQKDDSGRRITKDEMALIKSTFGNNEVLLKLMRKIFLPTLDTNAPLGQMIDVYRNIQTKGREDRDVAIELTARNMVIDHVEGRIMELYVISMADDLTPEQIVAKVKADSTK